MPVQQQQSSLGTVLGQRLMDAHNMNKDKPVEFGQMRLPTGIKRGVFHLQTIKVGTYKADVQETALRGQMYMMLGGVAVSPEQEDGEKVAGLSMQNIMIPMCDTPIHNNKHTTKKNWPHDGTKFEDHWGDFINFIHWFGVPPCQAKTSAEVEAYYMGAAAMLTDPKNPKYQGPRYVSFETYDFTPPADPKKPGEKPQPITLEKWLGPTQYTPGTDPSLNGVGHPSDPPPAAAMNPCEPFTEPPQASPPPSNQTFAEAPTDPADEIAALAALARTQEQKATAENLAAGAKLFEYAKANVGATQEQCEAATWEQLELMALGDSGAIPVVTAAAPPPTQAAPAAAPPQVNAPAVGSKWKFAKRKLDGTPLLRPDKTPFTPIPCEVATVDTAAKTVTLKDDKGQPVKAPGGKSEAVVKWEWLEAA